MSISGGDGLNWVEIGTFMMLGDSGGLSGNVNAIWPSKYNASDTHTHHHTHTCTTPQNTDTCSDGIPYDGVPGEDIRTAFIPLVIVIYLLAAAGIFFAIVCLAFNYIFRNRKYKQSCVHAEMMRTIDDER